MISLYYQVDVSDNEERKVLSKFRT